MITIISQNTHKFTQEDLDTSDFLLRFRNFRRSTNKGSEANRSSQKLLLDTLHVTGSLCFMALMNNGLIEQIKPKGFEKDPSIQPRWTPTRDFKQFKQQPRKLDAQMAIAWIKNHIKRQSPDAECSRETVRQILKGMEDVGLLVKDPMKFNPGKHTRATFSLVDIPRLVLFYQTIEGLYWEQREELEAMGKKVLELPRHMFRLIKDTFRWIYGVRFSSRKKEPMSCEEIGPVETGINDEISLCCRAIELAQADLSQAHFLELGEDEISELEDIVKRNQDRIDVLHRERVTILSDSRA